MKEHPIITAIGVGLIGAALLGYAAIGGDDHSVGPGAPVPAEVMHRIIPYSCYTHLGTEYPCSKEDAVRYGNPSWPEYMIGGDQKPAPRIEMECGAPESASAPGGYLGDPSCKPVLPNPLTGRLVGQYRTDPWLSQPTPAVINHWLLIYWTFVSGAEPGMTVPIYRYEGHATQSECATTTLLPSYQGVCVGITNGELVVVNLLP